MALASEVKEFAIFDQICKEGSPSGRDALLAGLMGNATLSTLELPWNALGGTKSIATCEAVAALLNSDRCRLQVLDLSCNLIGGVGLGGQLGALLATALQGVAGIKELRLDGNSMGAASAWSVISAASLLSGVKVSMVGCVNDIVHPYQHNPNAPYGSYRLNLADTGARELVRGVISLICRKKAVFEDGGVVHSPTGGRESPHSTVLQQGQYLQWEEWTVPYAGILTFKVVQVDGSLRVDPVKVRALRR